MWMNSRYTRAVRQRSGSGKFRRGVNTLVTKLNEQLINVLSFHGLMASGSHLLCFKCFYGVIQSTQHEILSNYVWTIYSNK